MEVEHIFASTNRQPKSCYWIQSESCIVISATKSVIAYYIDTKHTNKTIGCATEHEFNITSMAGNCQYFATGDQKGNLVIWKYESSNGLSVIKKLPKHHSDPINNIDLILHENEIQIVSSAGDGALKLTTIQESNTETIKIYEKSSLPLYPLCCSISRLPTGQILIAASFDDYSLRFYMLKNSDENSENSENSELEEVSRMKIGEDWTIDLNFTKSISSSSLKLAIANNDHLLRVLEIAVSAEDESRTKNRLQVEKKIIKGTKFEIKMETILQGHENWVTSSVWYVNQSTNELELGTCSMDKSVILWKINETGIWEDYMRLGAVGGGNLGFLGIQSGIDQLGGVSGILAYSYTGSLHLWWNKDESYWSSAPAPSGHYDSVRDLTWSPNGSYLLTTGYDQTTRLYSKYNLPGSENKCWAELARPQV